MARGIALDEKHGNRRNSAMTSELRISTTPRLGSIVLDGPKAINALSLDMIEGIAAALAQWADRPGHRGLLFEGAGEKGSCAGGDVRAARAHVIEGRPRTPTVTSPPNTA